MRVLQLIPDIGIGGAERMMTHLACELKRRNHEVAVVSLFPPHGNELEARLRTAGIEIFYLGKKLGLDTRMYPALFRVIRGFKPDVVHSHRYVLRYALPAMLAQRRCVAVHTVHSLAQREVGWSGRVVHRLAYKAGVAPVTIGKVVTDSFRNVYGREPRTVIPHGIPIREYAFATATVESWRKKEGFESNALIFGCVARLAPEKNLLLMVEAFALVAQTSPRVNLVIAGDGPDRNLLERRVSDLGLRDRVRFLGVRSDIPDVLSAMDVFALSSNWEGNPLSVMEAMAAGKPVVSTAVGGVPELVVDGVTGRLVQPCNPEELATAMTMLSNDESLRARMGQAGARRAAEHFDVTVMTSRYEALYAALLHSDR
jgi:glycosyltransferase involved in cell wall biosynthesis